MMIEHKKWILPKYTDEICAGLSEAGYSRLLAAVLQARGADTPEKAKEYLMRTEELLCEPMLISDMDKAVDRIKTAMKRHEKIAVYGDYDVDGITSSCLLMDYFSHHGLDCEVYIPDRLDEGYGINGKAIESLHESGIDLIITVDCGITAVSETEYAKSLGMDIIITDHHECPSVLPNASAVVDPKRPDSKYPFEHLAGVGVAFKLVCALEGNTQAPLKLYSDLVAVGTIADVMPLKGENRYLVYMGLEKLKNNPRPGLAALIEESGASKKPVSAATVGFTLAPRINAAGRLGETEISLKLLLTDSKAEASRLAKELCNLNCKRQELENKVWEDAINAIRNRKITMPIVLMSDSWHPGVVGIAASKLTEEFGVPTVIICIENESGKGSCRSYGNFNLFEALSACSEYLESFGGHAFAAGLNIKPEKIEAFREALLEYYRLNPPAESSPAVEPEICINNPEVLSIEGVESLDELEPCGSDNERPLMCICDALLENIVPVGNGKHLRMRIQKDGVRFDCVFFSHSVDSIDVREGMTVDICFIPQINDFYSHRSVQLLVNDIRPSETLRQCLKILKREEICVEDYRIFRPERADLAKAWHRIKQVGGRMELRYEELAERRKLCCMEPVKFCLCIRILNELNLLEIRIYNGRICCFTCDNGLKTELTNSRLFRLLWESNVRPSPKQV